MIEQLTKKVNFWQPDGALWPPQHVNPAYDLDE